MENIPALDKDLLEIEPQTSLKDTFLNFYKKFKVFLIKYCGWTTFAISLAVSLWFYFTDSPKLQYATWTQTFVSRNRLDSELAKSFDITLNGEKYDNLYLTIVEIENTGSKALDGHDISPIDSDPLRVIIPSSMIPLLPFRNEQTSKDIHLNLEQKGQEIILNFNYINPKSKISLSFLHKDAPEDFLKNGVKVIGSAKNLKPITEKLPYYKKTRIYMYCALIIYILTVIVIFIIHTRRKYARKEKENKRTECIKRQHEEIVALTQQVENKDETIKQKETFSNTLIGALLVIKQSLQNKEPIDKIFHIIDILTQDVLKNDRH